VAKPLHEARLKRQGQLRTQSEGTQATPGEACASALAPHHPLSVRTGQRRLAKIPKLPDGRLSPDERSL